MAEERNLAIARAPESSTAADPDVTKEELQRRMEEARESITQTVSEIKETVVNQYQQVRESISDQLDWREQYRRHTVPFTIGAAVGGLALGYAVGGAIFGDDRDDYDDDESDDSSVLSAPKAYAAAPVLGGGPPHVPAALLRNQTGMGEQAESYSAPAPSEHASAGRESGRAPLAAYADVQAPASQEPEEPKGPTLFERFKETKAYDRLQQELHTLGDRAVEELSKTARTVVLPALLNRVKDMIGIDLSTQREVAQRAQVEHQTEKVTTATASAANAPGGAAGQGV